MNIMVSVFFLALVAWLWWLFRTVREVWLATTAEEIGEDWDG